MSWHLFVRWSLGILALCVVASPSPATTKKPPPQPINLNTANADQLQLVPGIGPATADKILQMRKSYGAFKSVDDLRAVRGIGPKRIEKMRKYLTVGKVAAPKLSSPACASCVKPKPPPAKTTDAKTAAPIGNSGTAKAVAKPDANSSEEEEPH